MCTVTGIISVVAVLVVGSILCRHLILILTQNLIMGSSDIDFTVDSVDVQFVDRTLTLDEIHVFNPPDFTEPEALHISQIKIGFYWVPFLQKKPWFRFVDIRLETITIEQPANGPSNFELMEQHLHEIVFETACRFMYVPSPVPVAWIGGRSSRVASPHMVSGFDLRIDSLKLHLGTARILSHSAMTGEPKWQSMEINQEYVYESVTNLNEVVSDLSAELTSLIVVRELGIEITLESREFQNKIKGILDWLDQGPAAEGYFPSDATEPEHQFIEQIEGGE